MILVIFIMVHYVLVCFGMFHYVYGDLEGFRVVWSGSLCFGMSDMVHYVNILNF